MDSLIKNYKVGQELIYDNKVIIDSSGNVYRFVEKNSEWTKEIIGKINNPKGDGSLELSLRAGDGSSTTDTVVEQSKEAFELLKKVSVVEAIGLGPSLSANDLQVYDSDGKVQTNIEASKLADAILGKETQFPSGDDIAKGGNGNDILFGDQIKVGDLQGFAALQKMVADKLGGGLTFDKVTVEQVHDYITKHTAEFDQSDATGGKDELHGGAGNDILYGQAGDDTLYGEEGNDILYGGTGNDTLIGGAGDDILIGGTGDDVFVWLKGDQGSTGAPAVDVIKDFGKNASSANGNDVLNLKDLLQGENLNNIDQYLQFSKSGSNTVLNVSTQGKLESAGGNYDQKIILENVDLMGTSSSHDLIQKMITDGKLKIDQS